MRKAVLLLISILAYFPLFCSAQDAELIERIIELDSKSNLMITDNKERREVTVSILFGSTQKKSVRRAFTQTNGALINEGYKELTFDNISNDYLITIWNNTSNYGARTGVIIYKRKYWQLFVLPFDTFDLKDINGDGFIEIISDGIIYNFKKGILVESITK